MFFALFVSFGEANKTNKLRLLQTVATEEGRNLQHGKILQRHILQR